MIMLLIWYYFIIIGLKSEDLYKNVIGYFRILLIVCNGVNYLKLEVLGDYV